MQLREYFEIINRATQLNLHKCELFLHTRVLKVNRVSYAKMQKCYKSQRQQKQFHNPKIRECSTKTKSYQRQKVVEDRNILYI